MAESRNIRRCSCDPNSELPSAFSPGSPSKPYGPYLQRPCGGEQCRLPTCFISLIAYKLCLTTTAGASNAFPALQDVICRGRKRLMLAHSLPELILSGARCYSNCSRSRHSEVKTLCCSPRHRQTAITIPTKLLVKNSEQVFTQATSVNSRSGVRMKRGLAHGLMRLWAVGVLSSIVCMSAPCRLVYRRCLCRRRCAVQRISRGPAPTNT
jgi:hypothetical protein